MSRSHWLQSGVPWPLPQGVGPQHLTVSFLRTTPTCSRYQPTAHRVQGCPDPATSLGGGVVVVGEEQGSEQKQEKGGDLSPPHPHPRLSDDKSGLCGGKRQQL